MATQHPTRSLLSGLLPSAPEWHRICWPLLLQSARGLGARAWPADSITAGGELHPAPRTMPHHAGRGGAQYREQRDRGQSR